MDQINLTNIFRTFHPKAGKHILLIKNAHGTFSRIDHYWVINHPSRGTKRSRSYYAYFQITMLWNLKKKFGKLSNTWRLKNILLKNEGLTRKLKINLKYMEENENENLIVQTIWIAGKEVLKGNYIAI